MRILYRIVIVIVIIIGFIVVNTLLPLQLEGQEKLKTFSFPCDLKEKRH